MRNVCCPLSKSPLRCMVLRTKHIALCGSQQTVCGRLRLCWMATLKRCRRCPAGTISWAPSTPTQGPPIWAGDTDQFPMDIKNCTMVMKVPVSLCLSVCCVCVCVCACVVARSCVCVVSARARACVCVCVRARACVWCLSVCSHVCMSFYLLVSTSWKSTGMCYSVWGGYSTYFRRSA